MGESNPEQDAVIAHREGPMVVLAGAGSGKTRAGVHRIVAMVAEGADPARIANVTFSNKAAGEMTTRFRRLGCAAVGTTVHSLCLRILREDRTEHGTAWEVDSKDRARYVLKDVVGWKGMKWDGCDVSKLGRAISNAKSKLLWPDDPRLETEEKWDGRSIEAYARYQSALEDKGLLTFDDFLTYAHRHLVKGLDGEPAAAKWAAAFDYLTQDEYQDTNPAQVEIMRLLAEGHRNYLVVGDPAQAIYGFRGSSPDWIMRFAADWPGAKVVNMHRNYRCGDRIIACANRTLEPAKAKLDVPLAAERGVEGSVEVRVAPDLDDEARQFVAWAAEHRERTGTWAGATCLFRLNAQSRALEDALLRAKVPYVLVGGSSFYERKEVKDLLAYLRVAAGRPEDDAMDALKRCINAPFRFLGAAFVEKVQEAWAETPGDVFTAVSRAANRAGIQRRQVASAQEWAGLVAGVRQAVARGGRPSEVLDDVLRRTGYVAWLEKEEGAESIESSHAANVRELVRVAQQFATVGELLAYVDESVRAATKRREDGASDAVLLMSIHRSKGLEWPAVWVVGCNEKILPHAMGDAEEERRLFYVACTRAKDSLVVSYVSRMALRAGVREIAPSPFVLELLSVPGVRIPRDAGYEAEIEAEASVRDEEARAGAEARAIEGSQV